MMALSTSTGASLNATRPISQSSTRRLPSITTGREAMSHRRAVLAYECQVPCQPKENQPQLVVEAEGILVSTAGVCVPDCGRTRSHCLGQVEMSTNHQQCQTLHNYTGIQHGIERRDSCPMPPHNKTKAREQHATNTPHMNTTCHVHTLSQLPSHRGANYSLAINNGSSGRRSSRYVSTTLAWLARVPPSLLQHIGSQRVRVQRDRL